MKNNRRNQYFIILALIVAVLSVTIGFAAFSTTLTIKSSADVNPNSDTFSVVFSNINNGINTNPVVPLKSSNAITSTNGVINNSGDPTLSNLSATFTEPGQKVEYSLYVYNAGMYKAYLNSITFKGNKSCTASAVDTNYVDEACEDIKLEVQLGPDEYFETTKNINGHTLAVGGSEIVKITIEYLENGTRTDGPFTISFPDISLYYSTVSGVNEEYNNSNSQAYTMLYSTSSFDDSITNSDDKLQFKSSADIDDFSHVEIDGVSVDSSNYTLTSGSTIVTFDSRYALSLAPGNHNVKIVSNDGYAEADFEKTGEARSLITFSIDYGSGNVVQYTASQGMDWMEWVLSYGISTGDNGIVWLKIEDNYVYVGDIGNGYYTNSLRGVSREDKIIANAVYTIDGPTIIGEPVI